MKVEDLNKSKAYKKLNMSDVEKSELLEMCKSKKKELKSEIPDLSIRRTEKVNKDDKNSIIKNVVFAAGSIAATIAIVAGVAKYNGGKKVGKNVGANKDTEVSSEMTTVDETEVSSEMTTENDIVKSDVQESVIDWARTVCDELEYECVNIEGKMGKLDLPDGYEEREYSGKNGLLHVCGKDFVEINREPAKYSRDVGNRRVYFIVDGKAIKLQLDLILNREAGGDIKYVGDSGYYVEVAEKDYRYPLIRGIPNGIEPYEYEDNEVEEIKNDEKRKKVYIMTAVRHIDKEWIDDEYSWQILTQDPQDEYFKIPNLRIFDKNHEVKRIIPAAQCFYDSKRHSLIYLSDERKLYELMGIEMKDYKKGRAEFVANDDYEEILRAEGVRYFDMIDSEIIEISAIKGEFKKVNKNGRKMKYDYEDERDIFKYTHEDIDN